MRPKKRILLIDKNDDHLGLLRYVLETHAYLVLGCATAKAAKLLAAETFPDSVIIAGHFPGIVQLSNELRKQMPFVGQMIIGGIDLETSADVRFESTVSNAVILDRIRTLSARKRGPRKGTLPPHYRDREQPTSFVAFTGEEKA